MQRALNVRRKPTRRHAVPLFALMLGLVTFVASLELPTARAASDITTVVSMTFDDGHWSHYRNAHPILKAHGMRGTFYLNTGHMVERCPPRQFCWNLTWPQAREMYRDGHEMGGHTLHHVNLNQVTAERARRQVCGDRANLVDSRFIPAISFAYPYAAYNTAVRAIARDCGYSSARTGGGLPRGAYAETIPPRDPYALRTAITNNSLTALQKAVTDAERSGGGWVLIAFHEVCYCSDAPLRITPATLRAFLDWLKPRSANGTVVRTVGHVMRSTRPFGN